MSKITQVLLSFKRSKEIRVTNLETNEVTIKIRLANLKSYSNFAAHLATNLI
jgi:hypothetical protein